MAWTRIGRPRSGGASRTYAFDESKREELLSVRRLGKISTAQTSYGIMLCRLNDGEPTSVLAINRRYTYAFVDFLHGRYSKRDSNALTKLINKMTISEALELMTLDFDRMWYRVWLEEKMGDFYMKRKERFSLDHLSDSGAKLKKIVRGAHPIGVPLWEIPKGHKREHEGNLTCAMREFKEETGIGKRDYRIVPGVHRKMKYISDGVEYSHVYYVAVCTRAITLERLSLRQPGLVAEAAASRWLTLTDLKVLDPGNRIAREFKPITHLLKNRNKAASDVRSKKDDFGGTLYSATTTKKAKWVGPSFTVGKNRERRSTR